VKASHEYRLKAEQVERMAELISLSSDKQELLAQARYLRRRAEEVQAEPDFASNSAADPRQVSAEALSS
jgi:hypothetical protein